MIAIQKPLLQAFIYYYLNKFINFYVIIICIFFYIYNFFI